MSIHKYAKLAALGAIAVSIGVAGLYALVAFGSRHTPTGGIDTVHATLTFISVAVPAAAIIAAHLAFAKILFDEARKKSD